MKISKKEVLKNYDKNVYSLAVKNNYNFFLSNNILSKNCLMLLDEAQNTTWKQLMLFVTRMGSGSKVLIAGDVSQYDIQRDMMALMKFKEMVADIKGVGIFEFNSQDIMRHSILIEITERYEKLKYANKIKEEK